MRHCRAHSTLQPLLSVSRTQYDCGLEQCGKFINIKYMYNCIAKYNVSTGLANILTVACMIILLNKKDKVLPVLSSVSENQ